jgi:hypothetical protein
MATEGCSSSQVPEEDEAASSRIKYEPLDHSLQQIRLLKLLGDQPPDATVRTAKQGSLQRAFSTLGSWVRNKLGRRVPVKLNFDLVTTNLSDAAHLPYSAVSYSWGKDPATSVIGINGDKVRVPVSAEQALVGIFLNLYNLASSEPQQHCQTQYGDAIVVSFPYIWVDAICINQLDLAEKSQQVSMMDQIYSQADTTLIWLGRDDGTTKQAFVQSFPSFHR